MQSSLLKSVCYILIIINVTFCAKCNESFCNGKCYYANHGYDYGGCNALNECKCLPADVYVFDGVDRVENSQYINYSRSRIGYRNESWENIAWLITTQYPSIKMEDLKNLQTKIYAQKPAMYGSILQYFLATYKEHSSLETVLNKLISQYPEMSLECNNILMLLKRSETNDNQSMYTYEETEEDDISAPIETPPTVTTTTKSKNNNETPKVTRTQSRSVIGAGPIKQPNNYTKLTQTAPKSNTKQTTVEEESKTRHEKVEYETIESYEDSNEEFEK